MADPLGGGAGARGPGAPTINARKHQRQSPWEAVPKLEVQERPPSILENIDAGPWEVLELEIQKCPPSTLENINGMPLGGGAGAGGPGSTRRVISLHRYHRQK
jgi:hypothetical protein